MLKVNHTENANAMSFVHFLGTSLNNEGFQKGLSAIFLKQQGKLPHTCFGFSNLGLFSLSDADFLYSRVWTFEILLPG